MVYQGDSLQLNSIQIILNSEVNTISVCQDFNSSNKNLYTVIELKKHELSKDIIKYFYLDREQKESPLVTSFSCQGNMILVFPYTKARPIESFYVGEKLTLQESEKICNNLVLSCITGGLPFQILYLVLKQKLINLNHSGEVFFNYAIDFEEFDPKISEKECVVECARILLDLLKPHANDKKMVSYILLQKRVASCGYSRFTELYKDITISAADVKKRGLLGRIFDFFVRNKDLLFKILLWVSIVLLIIVIASFISQMIFGDIPWLRFFSGCFKTIGTESMRQ